MSYWLDMLDSYCTLDAEQKEQVRPLLTKMDDYNARKELNPPFTDEERTLFNLFMDHFETQRWWAELAFDPEELAAILAAVDRSIEQDRKARKQAVDAISLNRKYGEAREDELPGDRFEKLAIAPGTPLKEVDPVRMKEIIEAAFKRGEAVGRYLRGQTMRGPERPGQRYGG